MLESLELACNIGGILLEWSFPLLGRPQALRLYTLAITAEGPAEAQTDQLIETLPSIYSQEPQLNIVQCHRGC